MTVLLPRPEGPHVDAPARTVASTPLYPPVSVFMTVRDEADGLGDVVFRILSQEYPGEFELVLALGPSTDDTDAIARRLAASDRRIRLVENPSGLTPHGLNAGIGAAAHDVLVRVDGHAFIPPGYLHEVVDVLQRTGAANVGGRMLPEGEGPVSRAIAVTMGSRVGIGGAAFHVGGEAGPQSTVYLGAFRRDALEEVGGYDEHFLRAQDWELNHRLRDAGHEIWFEPSLGVTYRTRSTWREFARQQFRTGGWRRRVIERYPSTISLRYLAPPTVVLAILVGLLGAVHAPLLSPWMVLGLAAPSGYFAGVLLAGMLEARRLPWPVRRRVPVALAVMHLAWGAGFLVRAR